MINFVIYVYHNKKKIFYFKKKIIQIERRIGMFYQPASQQETDGTLKLGQFEESLMKGTLYKELRFGQSIRKLQGREENPGTRMEGVDNQKPKR